MRNDQVLNGQAKTNSRKNQQQFTKKRRKKQQRNNIVLEAKNGFSCRQSVTIDAWNTCTHSAAFHLVSTPAVRTLPWKLVSGWERDYARHF